MFHVLCCPSTSFFCKQIQGATCVFYVPLWGHLLVTALLDDGRGGISMWGVIWPWGDIHWIYAPRPGCWLATTRMIPNFLLGSYSPEKTSFPSGVLGAGVDQRYSWHKKKHTWKLTWLHSLKLTVRTAPARKLIPKRKLSSSNHQIFRCELLVSGRVNGKSPKSSKRDTSTHSWLFFFPAGHVSSRGSTKWHMEKRFPGWGVFLEFFPSKEGITYVSGDLEITIFHLSFTEWFSWQISSFLFSGASCSRCDFRWDFCRIWTGEWCWG